MHQYEWYAFAEFLKPYRLSTVVLVGAGNELSHLVLDEALNSREKQAAFSCGINRSAWMKCDCCRDPEGDLCHKKVM